MFNQLTNNDSILNQLRADCENCFGLCCVALPYAKSADFALDKDGGTPCSNLQSDYRCGIHENLRAKGYRGCTVYESSVQVRRYLNSLMKETIGEITQRQQRKCSRYFLLCNNFMKCFAT